MYSQVRKQRGDGKYNNISSNVCNALCGLWFVKKKRKKTLKKSILLFEK